MANPNYKWEMKIKNGWLNGIMHIPTFKTNLKSLHPHTKSQSAENSYNKERKENTEPTH